MEWRYSKQITVAVTLIVWGAIILGAGLVHFDAYGIEEGAARALLLNWTVVDRIINPIVIFGIPDLRALLFAPLAIYWPGSLIAAKVFSLLIAYAAALLLYGWSQRRHGQETALLATGLLLISPLILRQVDAIGSGPYLLMMVGLGAWFEERWRTQQRLLGAWFFLQMCVVAIIISLHPAGLAYPISLAWRWLRDPVNTSMQRHLFIGLGIVTVFVLLLQAGWDQLPWWQNPISALSAQLSGPSITAEDRGWLAGLLLLVAALIATISLRRELPGNLVSTTLILATVCGASAANGDWAILPLALVLYEGIALLIRWQQSWQRHSFAGQRGLVLVAVFATTITFMHGDNTLRQTNQLGYLSDQDELIQSLVAESAEADKPVTVGSQWPGRTMLVLKQPVFPLPKAAASGQELLHNIKGIDYLIFDHRDPENQELAHNIAELSGFSQTVELQTGGVIIKLLTPDASPPKTQPPPPKPKS